MRKNPNSEIRNPKFKLTVAYDGTNYQGWQLQKVGVGVQEKLEAALAKIFPSRPRVHGSSRTDTGVHALGMVAHIEVPPTECKLPARKLALALNAWLPEDIRVLSAARAPKNFHARFDAASKQYRYFIWNHPAMNPSLLAVNCTPRVCGLVSFASTEPAGVPPCQMLHGHGQAVVKLHE